MKKYKVIIADQAEQDLRGIFEYIVLSESEDTAETADGSGSGGKSSQTGDRMAPAVLAVFIISVLGAAAISIRRRTRRMNGTE